MGKSNQFLLNNRGFSILEVVVTAGIMMTLILGFSNVTINNAKHAARIEKKMELLGVKSLILSSFLADGGICSCNLNPSDKKKTKTNFDASKKDGSEKLTFKEIKMGCGASDAAIVSSDPTATEGMKVERINLEKLEPAGSATYWKGSLIIEPIQPKNTTGIKPIEVPLTFHVSSGTGSSEVTFCSTDP